MPHVYRHKVPQELKDKHIITTLGNFDGLHKGHQRILEKAQEIKQAASKDGLSPFLLMICFYPHPREAICPGQKIPRLLDLSSKLSVLSHFGIDGLLLIHFTKEYSKIKAFDFFNTVLLDETATRELVVGGDACIGHNREGNIDWIENQCEKSSLKLHIVDIQEHESSKIGSSDIRELILSGEVSSVESLFGWPYRITGKVMHGSNLGEGLGFPTANLKPLNIIYPKFGVYACYVQVGSEVYAAVVNVGIRPTFGGGSPLVEAHLMDVKGIDLYRKRISVYFIAMLREEKKFSSVEKLQSQIQQDVEKAKAILNERGDFRPPTIFSGN